MSDYEKLKEKYDLLVKDTQELAKFKIKIKELEEEVKRLNRIIEYRDKEIQELSLLIEKEVKRRYERLR